jgi:hypothetical protein
MKTFSRTAGGEQALELEKATTLWKRYHDLIR